MKRTLFALMGACLFVGAIRGSVAGQEHPVSGLRVSDETGTSIGQIPAPPGEKHFYLDAGTQSMYIAFDLVGTYPVQVQLRVLGPMGAILFQEEATYDEPGAKVVEFDNGIPLEDNEYVVNAYVGPDWYLADSLQMAVGEAEIVDSQADAEETDAGPAQATLVPLAPETPGGAESVPGGPSTTMLVLAGLGILVLAAVVVWAGWQAVRSR